MLLPVLRLAALALLLSSTAGAAPLGDAEVAWSQARASRQPVLLGWGSSGCAPCAPLQAGLFGTEPPRGWTVLWLDGDAPNAQRLAARLHWRAYPALALYDAQGRELTRLPPALSTAQQLALLPLAQASRPAAALLADAREGRPLSAAEWRLLAFYAWDNDEQPLVPAAERASTLARLAAACPTPADEVGTRLWLQALIAQADKPAPATNAVALERLLWLLDEPAALQSQRDVLVSGAWPLLKAVTSEASRPVVAPSVDAALRRLQLDTAVPRVDRWSALAARVELARLQAGAAPEGRPMRLPRALLRELRATAAKDDREITDATERQAVIPLAADALARAGLAWTADALLKANLAKAAAPANLMSRLAASARGRGERAAALQWLQQAWVASPGPSSRLQAGAAYLGGLTELTPTDSTRIERTAGELFTDAAGQPAAFYQRSLRSLQRASEHLQQWNSDGRHTDVMQRLKATLGCERLPVADPQRPACEALLAEPPSKKMG
jgi:hypothetical protein